MGAEKFAVVDLFAGCGGLSSGFEQAGFDVIVANEFWKPAARTHALNHPKTKLVEGDITKEEIFKKIISETKGRRVDVIIGGPPCQAYSLGGNRDPRDPRGQLFKEYVRLVDALKPPIFVMENVKGILTMKHYRENLTQKEHSELEKILVKLGRMDELSKKRKKKIATKEELSELEALWKNRFALREAVEKYKEPVIGLIKRTFKKIGYTVEWKLLNAADYGVPQLRERVFFMGTNNGLRYTFPAPTHANKPLHTLSGGKLTPWRTLRDAIWDLQKNPGEYYKGSFSSIYMSRNRRKNWDEPSFTIQAGARHAPLHPSSPKMVNIGVDKWKFETNDGERRLSVKECARMQTFPEYFVFAEGKIEDKHTQIGNAVPPLLAKRVAECVKYALSCADGIKAGMAKPALVETPATL